MRAVLLACSILSMSLLCGCETSTSVNQSTANTNSTINANAAQTSPVTDAASTRNFVDTAAADGMAEVELGHLAMQKANNPDVKQFAEKMVADHSKANAELKQLASSKNIVLPAGLNAYQKADKDRLSKLSGVEFDREYMSLMSSAHDKAVNLFQLESHHGTDTDIETWATKILPTLREHQTLAKNIAAKLGG